MSIKKLFKLHYYCLFNKVNTWIITISILLILFLDIYCWISTGSTNASHEMIIALSWESIFTFNKIIIVIFTIFLIGNFCLPENDNYKVIFVVGDVDIKKFYFVKYLMLNIILMIYVFITFLGFLIISMLFNKSFLIEKSYVIAYFSIYLMSLIYGYFVAILIKIVPSIFNIIVVFIIYILVDYIDNTYLLNTFFPTISLKLINHGNNQYLISLLITFILYLTLTIIFYLKRNK